MKSFVLITGAAGGLAKASSYPITFLVLGAVMFLVLPFMPVLFRKEPAAA